MIVLTRRDDEPNWQGYFEVTDDGLDFGGVSDHELRAELERLFAEDELLSAPHIETALALPYFNDLPLTPVAERLSPDWVVAACRMVLFERGIVTDYSEAVAQMRGHRPPGEAGASRTASRNRQRSSNPIPQ